MTGFLARLLGRLPAASPASEAHDYSIEDSGAERRHDAAMVRAERTIAKADREAAATRELVLSWERMLGVDRGGERS